MFNSKAFCVIIFLTAAALGTTVYFQTMEMLDYKLLVKLDRKYLSGMFSGGSGDSVKPAAKDDTAKPAAKDDTAKPAAKDDTAKPAAKDDTAKPAAKDDTAKPAAKDDTAKPAAKNDIADKKVAATKKNDKK